jgi:exopolyphosphatase/pppGpp-phosphohydrolase
MTRPRNSAKRGKASQQGQSAEQQAQTTAAETTGEEQEQAGEEKMITGAAIDIGSNSTEVTIAQYTPHHLETLQEQSQMIRLGESVKQTGEISSDMRDAVIAAIRQYLDMAQQNKAERILAVATQATRDARNRDAFLEDIQRETGLVVNVISGNVEATLTYHGATSGLDTPPDAGVLDVGGNSTELVTAHDKHITWLVSLPIGSGWLHDHYLTSDPPADDEIEDAQKFLQDYLQALHVPELPPSLVVTGSSAKELLKICKQALHIDESSAALTRQDLIACQSLLHSLPAQEIAQKYDQTSERARVLPGGALLILEMMNYLHQDEIRVTDRGVPEGVLLANVHYGEQWLDHDEVKVEDERVGQVPLLPDKDNVQPSQRGETFAEAGREELPKRVKKFVDWHGKVLKHEDVEDVHKMRVASRRLRATMDAYEVICKPKAFKKAYSKVKDAADLLGRVRDADVMIQHIQEQGEQTPTQELGGMQWLVERLQSYRKRQVQALDNFLQNFDDATLKQPLIRGTQQIEASSAKGASAHGKGQTH